ncbi:MAG: J domain-containing protein [Acidimicrobiales bacterium]
MLGVSPDASHDEVKRAYVRQAFRWHPDRRGDLDEAARAQADWRMRECNAAWAALGSPDGRAAYDDELRRDGLLPPRSGSGTEAGQAPSARARGATTAAPVVGRVASPTDQLVEPSRDFGIMVPKRHTGRGVALGVVVVLVALGVIAAVAASQDQTRAPADPELRTNGFDVGSCVVVLPGPAVAQVPCSQPNAGQVVTTTDYPRPCPTGTETLTLADQHLNLCLRPT